MPAAMMMLNKKHNKESKGNLHSGIVKGFVNESPNKFFELIIKGKISLRFHP
jgi:hypothetical protein